MQNGKLFDVMATLNEPNSGIDVQLMLSEDVFFHPEKYECEFAKPDEIVTNKYYTTWEKHPSKVWKVGNTVSINVDTNIYNLSGEKYFRTEVGKILGMSIQVNDNDEVVNVYIKTLCKNDQIKFFMLEDEDYLKPEEVGCFLISEEKPVKKKSKKINK